MADHQAMLDVAIAEARAGDAEGGIPIGGALFDAAGAAPRHAATTSGCSAATRPRTARPRRSATRAAAAPTATSRSPPRSPRAGTAAGLIRQFGIGTVVVGESRTFQGGDRLAARERGRGDRPRLAGVRRPAPGASSPAHPRSGTRTSASRCGARRQPPAARCSSRVAPGVVAGVIPWAADRVGDRVRVVAAGARARRAC